MRLRPHMADHGGGQTALEGPEPQSTAETCACWVGNFLRGNKPIGLCRTEFIKALVGWDESSKGGKGAVERIEF